jgi:hypothetical protein
MNFNRLYESLMETLEEDAKKCWDGYEKVSGIPRSKQGSCRAKEEDAEYKGRKVTLNKPTRGDVKKFKVYVKDPKTGNVKKVNFGHGGTSAKSRGEKTMKIRKSNPKARKSFRARHKCDQKKDKTTAGYWSCKKW